MKMKMWAVVAALGIVATLASGCGKKPGANGPGKPGDRAAAWLGYIPADSPLVLASLRPLPRELSDWMARGFGPVGAMIEQAIQKELSESSSDPQKQAVLTELEGKLSSREGLESIGLSLEPHFAVYGIGLSLAVRLELKDGKRLSDFVARLEKAAGKPMEKAAFEGIEYRTVTEDEITLVLAITGNELVFGLMHQNARTDVLPVLFMKKKPESSVADTKALESIVAKYELMGVTPGYIDFAALARMLTGRGSALATATLKASGAKLPELSAVCHQEIDQLVAIAPRVVFDYKAISAQGLTALGVWELRKDIALALGSLRSPVLGVDALQTEKPLFALGLGIDVGKALAWAKGLMQAVSKSPYQCPELAEVNQAATEIAQALDTAIPPIVSGLRSATVVVNDVQLGGATPSGSGYALVGMEDPMAALAMAQKEIPQLAEIQIQADGQPTAIPIGLPGLEAVYVTVQGKWIGAGAGPGMSEKLVALLRGKPAASGPFAVFGYNYKQLMELMQSSGGMATAGEEEAALLRAIGSVFGFVSVDFTIDDRGLVMTQQIQSL